MLDVFLSRRGVAACIVIVSLLIIGVGLNSKDGRIWLVSAFITESFVRDFQPPGLTDWHPQGARQYSSSTNINARPVAFARAMHTDLRGSDEVMTAAAPVFEHAWTTETDMFVAEGPVFDRDGNVYFCPSFGRESYLVVSIEPENGKRRWAIPGVSAGAGAPLIMAQEDGQRDLVYIGTYEKAMALSTDGEVIWQVDTGLSIAGGKQDARHHSYGTNYHPQTDSLVVVLGDGHIYVLDRQTGASRLAQPFEMPGAPTGLTNFGLPKNIADKANEDIAHMLPENMRELDAVSEVLHVAAGELQKVTNFFSIDSNSGRIWVASSLPDEADGKIDGSSDYGALYGLDLIQNGDVFELQIAVVASVPGGTASTPTVSADGTRVYIADAFNSVYAINALDGTELWQFDVGDKVAGSIVVSVDNKEIFANTRTDIKKLYDRGDHAELAWVANLDMYNTGRFQKNIKALGAEITANGIAFTGAAGIVAGKQKFPLKLGAGLIDRQTGEIRYFAEGAEDSVSSMSTAPDGSIYVGNSPLRRALGRATFGRHVSPQPVLGGVTRFKPRLYHLLILDILWAATTRAENAIQVYEIDPRASAEDVRHIQVLLTQLEQVLPQARKEAVRTPVVWDAVNEQVDLAQNDIANNPNALHKISKDLRLAMSLITDV